MDAVLADWQKWVCMHPSQLFASLFSLQIATMENGHVKTEDPKKWMADPTLEYIGI
jgi:hypothetical protein